MVFFCEILRQYYVCNISFAVVITTILTGIIFIWVNGLDGYPQKYQHSPQILCINCGRDMNMFGQCCAFSNSIPGKQYDCIQYSTCRQMEEASRQNHQDMENLGKLLIICGSAGFCLFICVLIIIYKKRMIRERRILNAIDQIRAQHDRLQQDRLHQPLIASNRVNRPMIINLKRNENQSQSFIGDGQTCSICLQEYDKNNPQEIRKTCKHKFHRYCLQLWQRNSKQCPLCRSY